MHVNRLAGGVVAAVAAVGLMAPMAGAATAIHHRPNHPVKVYADCVHARYQPTRVILACGDANATLTHNTYRLWTRHRARGHSVFVLNTCRPDCASGQFKKHRAKFAMKDVKVVSGHKVFTKVVVHWGRNYRNRSAFFPAP